MVLPRHFSGEPIPILKYIPKNFYPPLVISIDQGMPVEENESGLGHQLSDVEDDISSESGLFEHSPPTLSEWLDACERTKTPEEVEEEQEAGFLSLQFEAYFLAYSPSATPPSICHVPVLCMANEEQLPVLMSSLLYQRRVWHISDPLIGLEFSKYDTAIKLVLGWLEEDPSSSRALVGDSSSIRDFLSDSQIPHVSHGFILGRLEPLSVSIYPCPRWLLSFLGSSAVWNHIYAAFMTPPGTLWAQLSARHNHIRHFLGGLIRIISRRKVPLPFWKTIIPET